MSPNEPHYDGVHAYPVAKPTTDQDRRQIAKIAANARWSRETDRHTGGP